MNALIARRSSFTIAAAVALAGTSLAANFQFNSIVLMRCSNGSGAESVILDEYDVSGASPVLVQSIPLPTTGVDAVSMPGLTNHDRHLHRSTNGRFLTFAAYNTPVNPDPAADPSAAAAATAPRVIGIVARDGTIDLSTRLTTAYDFTSVRGAVTTDGNLIWVGGDNASGATVTGGTVFTTRGSSSSVNLSQVQVQGGPRTPDNIRDINVFDGQLYNSSGSNSSVGKALFSVGTGLPQSGSQTLTRLTNDNASVSCFYFLDASATEPGVDVVYTSTSTGNTLRKHVKIDGVWTPRGSITGSSDIEQVCAKLNNDGTATIYAVQFDTDNLTKLYRVTDAAPYTGSLSGGFGVPYITPPSGFTLGGVDFAPRGINGDINGDCSVNLTDLAQLLASFGTCSGDANYVAASDLDASGCVNLTDLAVLLANFGSSCN